MPSVQTLKNGRGLLQEMQRNPDLVKQINTAKNYSQVQQIAKDAGFDLTGLSEEEAKAYARGGPQGALAKGELSDEDLEDVSGGWGYYSYSAPSSSTSGSSSSGGSYYPSTW